MSDGDKLQGWNLANPDPNNFDAAALSDAAQIMYNATNLPKIMKAPAHKPDSHVRFVQGAAEMVGTVAAGIAGAVAWGTAGREAKALGMAGSLGLAAGAGAIVKYAVKSAVEDILLKPEDRDVSKKDLAWGTVDGLSGIIGSTAEAAAGKVFLRSIGKEALGEEVSAGVARMGGEKVVAQQVIPKIKLNLIRGLSGGAAGTFAWSVPHRIADNWDEIKEHPYSGLNKAKSEVLSDTLFGTFLGGGLAAGGTALFHSPALARMGLSSLTGEEGVTRLDLAHVNDHHSELVGSRGLARLVTKVDELRAKSASLGRTHEFVNAGDLESGNVVFAFTDGGWVENEAMARAGEKIRIPGNHPYDVAGGGSDVDRYQRVMKRVMSDHPEVNLLVANLDLAHYPEYASLTKPYTTIEVAGRNGTEKVGIIGLITEEGAVSKIQFQDPAAAAEKYISELHDQGIKKILILSHQGLSNDVALAQKVKGITAIIGGHSHDIEPVPRWVTQGSDSLSFWQRINPFRTNKEPYAGWNVPIVQAGSNGRWLGELNLAMQADGAADRYLTTGRLHAITKKVPADKDIESFILANIGDLNKLRAINYNAEALAPYSLANIRNQETALGNLVSDATAWGVRRNLGPNSVDVVLTHSGGIRAGINAHDGITRFDLSNVFINAGNPEMEQKEMVLLEMSGRELKDALEFGVHDLGSSTSGGTSLMQRARSFLSEAPEARLEDKSGYFLQISDDMKYSFDLSKQRRFPTRGAGGRVSDVMMKGADGEFAPVDDGTYYKVLTRYHEAEKWFRFGVFDKGEDFDHALRQANAKPVELSRVEFTGEYLRGKTIDPAVDGRVDGRITNLTPKPWQPRLRPGLSLVSYSGVSAFDKWMGDDDNHGRLGFFK